MSKPDDIPQDVWEAATRGRSEAILAIANWIEGGMAGPDDSHNNAIDMIFARAILAAKAETQRDLVDCLSDMTEHYVQLAGCGDCGFWDPEQESEVIAARKMIAAYRKRGEA